jgi:D-alanyl-D-alanine carboxypeptidase
MHSDLDYEVLRQSLPAGKSVFVSEEVGAGKWLSKNAWKYGWLMSYPRNKQALTCYRYEPWHYRYYGRDLAAKIHASGVTTREYLWANFTTAVVPPASPSPGGASAPPPSAAAATPGPSPTGGEESSASPAATATSIPSSLGTALATPPAAPAGTWLGLQPPAVVVAIILIAGSILTLAMLRSRRQRR